MSLRCPSPVHNIVVLTVGCRTSTHHDFPPSLPCFRRLSIPGLARAPIRVFPPEAYLFSLRSGSLFFSCVNDFFHQCPLTPRCLGDGHREASGFMHRLLRDEKRIMAFMSLVGSRFQLRPTRCCCVLRVDVMKPKGSHFSRHDR